MRRVLSVLGVLSAVPVVLAVPVLSRPTPPPRPVAPHVTTVAMGSTALAATDTGSRASTRVVAGTTVGHTGHAGLVGASWRGTLASGATIQVRTQSGAGWSQWADLTAPDGGPDDGSVDARAAAARRVTSTEPVWIGSARTVQARVVDAAGVAAAAPAGLHLVLVDGGTSDADAAPGAASTLGGSAAHAAQSQPTIYTRAQWGADERLRSRNSGCGSPSYGSTIKMGFIHHTDTGNGYSASSVPSIIRSIYAYHVESNGWCDIGYNFLVDRFGRIWEGRYGGITKPVIGAHTGGFNTDTFGASLIGTYSSTAPSSAMLGAVEKLFAWRLGSYYRDPAAKTTVVAGSFSESRYPAGSTVTFNEVSGHRDADQTTCPGSTAYADLGSVRSRVITAMGAGFVSPSVSPSTIRMLSGQAVKVAAGVVGTQTWTASIADHNGVAIRTLTGTASRSSRLSVLWDGNGSDGLPAAPGTYKVTLTGANSAGAAAVPFVATVTVTPPVTISGPSTTSYGARTALSGTAAPSAPVTVTLQPATAGAPAVTQTVTASATGAWTTTFAPVDDTTWSATSHGWSTTAHTTKVAPSVTPPTGSVGHDLFTAPGGSIALTGTALPGTTVTTLGQPPVVVGPDGHWSGLGVTPTTPVTVVVKDGRGLAAPTLTAYAVHAPTAKAPSTGYAKRAFTVTGDAGAAPVSVQLWTQPAGASGYSLVKSVVASSTGAYSVAATLPDASAATPLAWRVVTTAAGVTYGTVQGSVSVLPAFAPTATGPATGYYGHSIAVHGSAVPGDTVTLWTRPAAGGTWVKAATATASSASAWQASYLLVRDTAWRVTTASGTSSTGATIVRPTLHVPATAAKGALINGWGYALPGQKVAVYRRPLGTTSWRYIGTVTAASNGRWAGHWHLLYPMNVQVRSHGQSSTVFTIRYA